MDSTVNRCSGCGVWVHGVTACQACKGWTKAKP